MFLSKYFLTSASKVWMNQFLNHSLIISCWFFQCSHLQSCWEIVVLKLARTIGTESIKQWALAGSMWHGWIYGTWHLASGTRGKHERLSRDDTVWYHLIEGLPTHNLSRQVLNPYLGGQGAKLAEGFLNCGYIVTSRWKCGDASAFAAILQTCSEGCVASMTKESYPFCQSCNRRLLHFRYVRIQTQGCFQFSTVNLLFSTLGSTEVKETFGDRKDSKQRQLAPS